MPIVSFDTLFTIMQLLLLLGFQKIIETKNSLQNWHEYLNFTWFKVFKLFWLIKSKAIAPFISNKTQNETICITQYYAKNVYQSSTSIVFISDHI